MPGVVIFVIFFFFFIVWWLGLTFAQRLLAKCCLHLLLFLHVSLSVYVTDPKYYVYIKYLEPASYYHSCHPDWYCHLCIILAVTIYLLQLPSLGFGQQSGALVLSKVFFFFLFVIKKGPHICPTFVSQMLSSLIIISPCFLKCLCDR